MCVRVHTSQGEKDLDENARQEVTHANEFLASQALRVLAVARCTYPLTLVVSTLPFCRRLVLLGLWACWIPRVKKLVTRSSLQSAPEYGWP